MPRKIPTPAQNFLSSVILPVLSLALIPVSVAAVLLCLAQDQLRRLFSGKQRSEHGTTTQAGCVIISGGRMSKGLTLARAFKRAGWKVIGVEEEGWGELCPLRFSSCVHSFHLVPPASTSYDAYSSALVSLALLHSATLFIPVSGAGSSDEDARTAHSMFLRTGGRCQTFVQDPVTMSDLHDKDRFMALLERLGIRIPRGKKVQSVQEAMEFLTQDEKGEDLREPRYVLKCMGLDENRGDMTLFPLLADCQSQSPLSTTHGNRGDTRDSTEKLVRTRRALEALELQITPECPYVFQEYIPGQEYCTHASVIDGQITSFVCCPSNDMLMTYEDVTSTRVGRRAEEWTKELLQKLKDDPLPASSSRGYVDAETPTQDGLISHLTSDAKSSSALSNRSARGLTGHFAFDFILSNKDPSKDGELYPIECNARCHTAIIMLPLDQIASCYTASAPPSPPQRQGDRILRPAPGTRPRSWIYNDLIVRLLPRLVFDPTQLANIHPSLPACAPSLGDAAKRPREGVWQWRVENTLVADDWVPFLVLWHVFWPTMLLRRWWAGQKWTRMNVSTGRIFEA